MYIIRAFRKVSLLIGVLHEMKISIQKFYLLFLTVALVFIMNLMMMNIFISYREVQNIWVFLLVYCFFIIIIVFRKSFKKKNIFFLLIWELLIFSVFISKYIHGDFQILEYTLYSALVPFCFFTNHILKYKNTILLSYVVAGAPFLFFMGTSNNNLGMLLSMIGIVLLNILISKKVNNKYIYLIIFTFTIAIYLTLSRTALVAFLSIALLQIFIMIKRENASFLGFIRKIITIIALFIIIYFTSEYIIDLIFSKYSASHLDITSGRETIWQSTIQTGLTWFGNGEDYFSIYNVRDAHNSYIQVLGEYGFIGFILFVILSLYILIKLISVRKLDYFSFFLGYFLLGLTENLFFINSRLIGFHLLLFLYLGCLVNEQKSRVSLPSNTSES